MNYNEDKFKIVSNIKKFILDSEKLFENVPKKDLFNREYFKECEIQVLLLVYTANLTTDKEDKKAVQAEIIARLSIIDFLLERAYVKKYITEKELYDYSKRLAEIIKMIEDWMKSSG